RSKVMLALLHCCFCMSFLIVYIILLVIIFFFFQAEDGIRDDLVTGVQTCALPIFQIDSKNRAPIRINLNEFSYRKGAEIFGEKRSEERRVGKECRSRWSTDH